MIERLLKQCDAAQIGVREMNRAERLSRGAARSAPDEVGARADHRVSPTHHVEALGERADFAVRARQVGERHVRPRFPIGFEQPAARGARVVVAQRVVVSEDGRAAIKAALVRCGDVAERGAFV